jgi:hypothetical protein
MKKKNTWLWLAGGAAAFVLYNYFSGQGSADPFSEGTTKGNDATFL